ncbi:MAG: PHP-associated domain-containing protein [Bryobacteraceae bacterium]
MGGSDAHTLAQAGLTWTDVPRASGKSEFFEF